MRDVADTYLSQHPHWRESTRATHVFKFAPTWDALGNLEVQAVKPPDVRRYILKVHRDGKAPKTQEATRGLLRAVFQTALHDGLITRKPVDAVKAIRDNRTAEERDDRLIDEQQLLPTFILGTVMRGGAAAELTRGSDGLSALPHSRGPATTCGQLWVPVFDAPKIRNSTRWVPMGPGVAEVLGAQQSTHPVIPAALVWVTETNAPMGKERAQKRGGKQRGGSPYRKQCGADMQYDTPMAAAYWIRGLPLQRFQPCSGTQSKS